MTHPKAPQGTSNRFTNSLSLGSSVEHPDNEERGLRSAPQSFGGLPRLAKNNPRRSVALRKMPAFFKASDLSCPGGIKRAFSRASVALASQSMASLEG